MLPFPRNTNWIRQCDILILFFTKQYNVIFAFLRPFFIAFQNASHKCINIISIPLQNVDGDITFHITIVLVLHERILIIYITCLH